MRGRAAYDPNRTSPLTLPQSMELDAPIETDQQSVEDLRRELAESRAAAAQLRENDAEQVGEAIGGLVGLVEAQGEEIDRLRRIIAAAGVHAVSKGRRR
jgi:hypothetical protein